MIGRPVRSITNIMTVIFLLLFLGLLTIYMLGFFRAPINEDMRYFFVENPLGWSLIIFVGVLTLSFSILMVAFWMMDTRWKDIRYKMAFYLYHSKVSKNDKIPLPHLARVGVCSIEEISQTLENMIARSELKGIVDRDKGIYIHKGLTRRGMKVLAALPPVGVSGLQEVKKMALKGYTMGKDTDEEMEELEEMEMEELPSAHDLFQKKNTNKVECPHCGRMNVKEHHFCTFCGEVI